MKKAAKLSGREKVVDAYCGVGTIGMWIAVFDNVHAADFFCSVGDPHSDCADAAVGIDDFFAPAQFRRFFHFVIHLAKDYHVEYIQPVDMFPQTAHVESVVSLKLK